MANPTLRLIRLSYSLTDLVTALSKAFRAQSRITNPDDYDEANAVLGRAINFIEIRSGIAIASQVYSWVPVMPNQVHQYARSFVPVRGVVSFTVDRGGVDVSSEYWMEGAALDPYAPQWLSRDGNIMASDVVTLVAGFVAPTNPDDPLPLPAALIDVILRYSAYLWEFREAATLGQSANLTPDWFNESMAIFWIPRA